PRWAEYWEKEKLFHVETPPNPRAFTVLLPPPNVTGNLHMGHMFEHTESDILVRWRRMRGETTLWVPGTDHAGIATQMLVERQLASEGVKRTDLGREKFEERVWEWRRLYGGNILKQMKRLGDSVDWSREYFTMNENLNRAVREVFVRLWEQGLIYRGEYIVNWCPGCLTAISDLEVVHEEQQGKLYEIRYPLADGSGSIHIATTRPETMLGDVAVAVNPHDERYRLLIGKKLRLPLMNREIPIIGDELANPEFGTGAVKVTPAHDPNDFTMGKRHNLPMLKIMNEHARINANGGTYAGLDRYEARKRVLADLEAQGLLVHTRDHALVLGKCSRSKDVVEPTLSMQWFVKIQPLADRAIAAVSNGHIRFTPENNRAIYLNWMSNIYDWCISRQLWWGHRIPAWYCVKNGCAHCKDDVRARPIVSREEPRKCPDCGGGVERETDVLDTWFSSALLPFTAFGWPEHTRDLDVFYPTTLMVTGFDILFFWVARMIMMGCHFMKDMPMADGSPRPDSEAVPFRDVYIHALVRDAERQKMSKTKGNVVDPIDITEKYGTDAVRFTLAAMASPGTDIAFNQDRIAGYRNFANKIWNAARFMFISIDNAAEAGLWQREAVGKLVEQNAISTSSDLLDRWIDARFQETAWQINKALAEYRFDEAANLVYQFFWDDLCAVYVEAVKLRLDFSAAEGRQAKEALQYLVRMFEGSLRLLSPFMPFITEEIWHALYEQKAPAKSIALTPFPLGAELSPQQKEIIEQVRILRELLSDIRNRRAELQVEPKQKVPVRVFTTQSAVRKLVESNREFLERQAMIEGIDFADESMSKVAGVQTRSAYEVAVVYEKKIDLAAERYRLAKEQKKLEAERDRAQSQLANESFLAKAPAHVVEGLRRRLEELEQLILKTRAALEALDQGGASSNGSHG
ncbi:MAG TPA: valine--tRNA ligase, partial [Terriglobales bacterium]|nr:valine--tRNA ligase [Terriglobales bacterium]